MLLDAQKKSKDMMGWETYQVEQEEVLGRGKRLKRAISYKETFASTPNEALSESDNEEEPRQEYTPAGQALKEKFAKLRARQKERIARRQIAGIHSSVERSESSMQFINPCDERMLNGDINNKNEEDAHELNLTVKPEEVKCSQPFDSMVKNGGVAKNGHKRGHSSYPGLPVSNPENLSEVISPSKDLEKTASTAQL
ncbi:protein CHROMATIN REMODELING 4-like isoform X3 [Phalaenopsis equestris]|uniref:protein CHROMATIN REMODELING 4-like isoform X3 n=1 Tax=Phalaenopsis equestris TaxID=78828 RepID=UPI0009E3E14A|nr:protein CHROMATIN REMODELING 4-like isoform X3 [Phalaenopsis equestris]